MHELAFARNVPAVNSAALSRRVATEIKSGVGKLRKLPPGVRFRPEKDLLEILDGNRVRGRRDERQRVRDLRERPVRALGGEPDFGFRRAGAGTFRDDAERRRRAQLRDGED